MNISVQVFATEGKAEAHALKHKKQGYKICGPTQLGTVDVVDNSGEKPAGKCFEDFAGKWGIAIFS